MINVLRVTNCVVLDQQLSVQCMDLDWYGIIRMTRSESGVDQLLSVLLLLRFHLILNAWTDGLGLSLFGLLDLLDLDHG